MHLYIQSSSGVNDWRNTPVQVSRQSFTPVVADRLFFTIVQTH